MENKRLFKVKIKETVSETFDIYATSIEEAVEIVEEKYYDCEIVLEPGNLEEKKLQVTDVENDEVSKWREF